MRSLSVAIMGPMGNEKSVAGKVPVGDHLKNIASAVNVCALTFRMQGKPVQIVPVWAEKISGGAISPFVFMHMDQADIAIADISVRSPSVMYEIAVLHALGRPTILLDFSKQVNDPPFYLKGQLIKGVNDFSVKELTAVLTDTFDALVNNNGFSAIWANPISDFYSVPLVDAQAASGLATGHFHNFLRWVIADGYGVLASMAFDTPNGVQPLTHIVVVRPTSLQQNDDTRAQLNKIPGFRQGTYQDRRFPRGQVVYNSLGPYIIDYPQPLESIHSSLSFTRLRELLIETNPKGAEAEIAKFEDKIITAYFETLMRLARKSPGYNHNKLKFMTLDELKADLGHRG